MAIPGMSASNRNIDTDGIRTPPGKLVIEVGADQVVAGSQRLRTLAVLPAHRLSIFFEL